MERNQRLETYLDEELAEVVITSPEGIDDEFE